MEYMEKLDAATVNDPVLARWTGKVCEERAEKKEGSGDCREREVGRGQCCRQ